MERPAWPAFYRIYKRQSRSGDPWTVAGETCRPPFTVAGLDPGVAYDFRLMAVSAEGVESEPAELKEIRTLIAIPGLLQTARDLIGQGAFNFAVITAQTAADVHAERAIARLLLLRDAAHLDEAISVLIRSYTWGGSVLRFYKKLSGDTEIDQPGSGFWIDYTTHVNLRNRIVHRAHQAAAAEAVASVSAVERLIDHVEAVLSGLATE